MQHTLRGTSSHLVAGAHGNSIGSKFLQVRQCTVDGSCARLLSTLVRIRHGTYPVSHVYAPPKQVNGLAAARLAHPLGPCRANTECRGMSVNLGKPRIQRCHGQNWEPWGSRKSVVRSDKHLTWCCLKMTVPSPPRSTNSSSPRCASRGCSHHRGGVATKEKYH